LFIIVQQRFNFWRGCVLGFFLFPSEACTT
jgi:hypothetical protein